MVYYIRHKTCPSDFKSRQDSYHRNPEAFREVERRLATKDVESKKYNYEYKYMRLGIWDLKYGYEDYDMVGAALRRREDGDHGQGSKGLERSSFLM